MSDDGVHPPAEAFEVYFRGSREDIRRRLSFYLPLLEEAGVRDLAGPVLDLGTGRGEWLAMLAEHGHTAVGIDVSKSVASVAREAGLDVTQADALEDLRARPKASLAAVTGFHVVEHLDPTLLGELLAQIHRVLAPGGVVVLETPNPENVTVATTTFHLDVEHVRPIPPTLIEFHARDAGFKLPWIARVNRALLAPPLSEVPGDVPGALAINAAIYAINGLLFTAPDYALVAQKSKGRALGLDGATFERLFGAQPRDLETYRRNAAEEAARRLEAEKTELAARAAELERVAAEATELAEEAAARAGRAEARAQEAESQTNVAWADFAAVSDSLSWRVTAPLRLAASLARRSAGASASRPGRTPKIYAKLAVGHPMRWALSQPRLGPALDKTLARMPAVDHKVRVAIHETQVVRTGTPPPATSAPAADLADLSEAARSIVADVERALGGENA
jgi:SAM-dependent methyltransferase